MMRIFKIDFRLNVLFFITFLASIFVGFSVGIMLFPDSEGYLQMDIFRSAGYPLFLKFHHIIFGNYYLFATIISQFLFLFYAILWLLNTLYLTVLKSTWSIAILFLILVLPIFYEFNLSFSILSEAIAYPLYLLVISQLISGFFFKKTMHFYIGLVLLLLLISVRGQFLFVFVVYFLSIILFFRHSLLSRKTLLLIGATVLVPFVSVAIDVSYHFLKHNMAVTTPWTGIQIAALPFFVSEESDANLFEDAQEKAYFTNVFQKLKSKNLLLSQVPKDTQVMNFFYEKYTTICNGTINADGEIFFIALKTLNQKTVANDRMSAKIATKLFAKNWKEYAKIYFKNVGFGFGTNKYFLMMLLFLVLSVYKILSNDFLFYWLIFIGSLCAIGNVLIVSLAEPAQSRYVFYNNWVLIVFFLIFVEHLKKPQNVS